MRKYVLSLLFLMMAACVMGQKKSIVYLIKSERSVGTKMNGRDVLKVYKGTFKQDYSLLSSDSAYFYIQENAFDAFGDVNINQGDTLNIFSDKLKYNGNTKIAILTDNVKMVDKDATLTTDYLTYNTATRIGTYTGGGKLVNKDNVLTSKNGYYFAFSRDSYFRYNVVLTTVDALIKTDTLRYNTGSRIAYFYGPTNIYGTKDKDTLYTENGLYNTITEQAYFGKKNFYKQSTKSLKGDSLFYDRIKGYGRAVKNVTFNDTEQKTTIKGDLGTYYKAEDKAVVTQNAYVVLITEQKDSTKTDSAAKPPGVNGKAGIPSTGSAKNVKTNAAKQLTNLANVAEAIKPGSTSNVPLNSIPVNQPFAVGKKDSARIDSVGKVVAAQVNNNKELLPPNAISSLDKVADGIKPGKKNKSAVKDTAKTPQHKPAADTAQTSEKLSRDSIFLTADTIETQVMTYKDLKLYQEKQRLSHQKDTSAKARKLTINEKESKTLIVMRPSIPTDTSYFHRSIFRKPRSAAEDSVLLANKLLAASRKARRDSLALVDKQNDPVFQNRIVEPKDTARIRILIAHHHAKLFKSDLQAKADSIFYSSSDSTIRCYVNPIIWTQGSQLSGDTVYLQMKNKKVDNIEMFAAAFIVNIEPGDSIHFNQMASKKMRGFFRDNKLQRMYAAGNAESIYFQRDSGKVSNMQRSLSSRIIVNFKDNKIKSIDFVTKAENRYLPINKVKEEEKILTGFIWKPKERPLSKESILHPPKAKPSVVKPPGKNLPVKKGVGKPVKGSLQVDSLKKAPQVTTPHDTSIKTDTAAIKVVRDTAAKTPFKPQPLSPAKDTVVNKPAAVKKD